VHYIATVVHAYRMLIDEYLRTGRVSDFAFYEEELLKAENRSACTGFLFGSPGPEGHLYDESAGPSNDFLGIVLDYDEKTGIVTAEQRNNFGTGAEVEFFGPKLANTRFRIGELYDGNMEPLDVARHPRQVVKFPVPFKLNRYDMFRRV
ncbi:MAG TPA: collagenase-like protease, partial [Acholeplasmataceae bacterium]|nr:collagenase-like protease [Acholeplasmataceae bacterium]